MTEVVAIALHGETVNSNGRGLLLSAIYVVGGIVIVTGHLEDLVGNEVLAGAVALHNGGHHVLRHVLVVGQQLLSVLGQTVAAVTEAGVIVVRTDTRIEADAIDNSLGIETFHFSISIELIKVTDTESQIGVGEELHCLGLFHTHKEGGHILLDGRFLQKTCKDVSAFGKPRHVGEGLDGLVLLLVLGARHHLGNTDDDAAGIEIVVERLALPQEFGAEQQVELLDCLIA